LKTTNGTQMCLMYMDIRSICAEIECMSQ